MGGENCSIMIYITMNKRSDILNNYLGPKIIEVEIKEQWSLTPEQIKDMLFMRVLNSHKLLTLKQIFFYLFNKNIPGDLEKSDKSNISRVVLYYLKKKWSGEELRLKDKFFECDNCNKWTYCMGIRMDADDKRKICMICWKKENPNFKHPKVQSYNGGSFLK